MLRIAIAAWCAVFVASCKPSTRDDEPVRHPQGPPSPAPSSPPPRLDAGTPDAARDEDAGNDVAPTTDLCGSGDCDLWDLSACGEEAACQYLLPADGGSSASAMCVPAGSRADGEPCRSHAECAAGLDCTAEGSEGMCRHYCCELNSTRGCPGGQACRVAIVDEGGAPLGVNLCDACDVCDPLASSGCEGSDGCYVLPATQESSACLVCQPSTGDLPEGEACEHASDCKPGLACVRRVGAAASCRPFCNVAAPGSCPSCASLHVPGAPELGACVDM